IQAGRMMQIQVIEHLAESLLLGSFERMALEYRSGFGRRLGLADHVTLLPEQVAFAFAPDGGKEPRFFILSRQMLQPGKLLAHAGDDRRWTPLVLRQFFGHLVQRPGPLVIADAPSRKTCPVNLIEVLARAGPAISVKVTRTPLPEGLIFGQKRRQMLAHIAGTVQNPVQQEWPHPQRLPTQSQIPIIVPPGALKLFAIDLDLRVIKKDL